MFYRSAQSEKKKESKREGRSEKERSYGEQNKFKKKKRKVELRRCCARGREKRTGESEHLVEGRK